MVRERRPQRALGEVEGGTLGACWRKAEKEGTVEAEMELLAEWATETTLPAEGLRLWRFLMDERR